ncbi:MAG: cytochrome [Myxococcaceae bacterium]|nr:cytochrome [Myxococcaceae bacterium]
MDGTIPSEPPRSLRRVPILPNGVMGMLIFITAEVMFFAGMLSAFTIVRASNLPMSWPPPGQPLLPATATGLNTAVLILSGLALWFAHRAYQKPAPSGAEGSKGGVLALAICLALGLTFVGLQGWEWVRLLGQGLTMTSSTLGSFFYLIIGVHGAHALAALGLLAWALIKLRAGTLKPSVFYTTQAFWYFVVGMWPVIYVRVYF